MNVPRAPGVLTPAIRLLCFGSANVKVVLRVDVPKLGAQGEVVEVSRGYARNVIVPRYWGAYATKDNVARFAAVSPATPAPAAAAPVPTTETAGAAPASA